MFKGCRPFVAYPISTTARRVETEYTSSAVDTYRRETRKVIDRFLERGLSFPECIAALDAALADFIPRMPPDQLPALRALMLANNEIVMKEMERRARPCRPLA